MADFTYNDAYRAAQDATRDMRDMLNRILQQTSRTDDIQMLTGNMQRTLEDTRRSVMTISSSMNMAQRTNTPPGFDPNYIQQMSRDIQAINIRLKQMEDYLSGVSQYFTVLRERQEEEERYKRA